MTVLALGCACSNEESSGRGGAAERRPLYYRSPMDPSVTSKMPMKDSMGMDYVPIYADDPAAETGEIRLSPAVIQKLGVRTVAAEFGPLQAEYTVAGSIGYDETAIRDIYAPVGGWIEKLSARSVGEPVRAGQLLFELYSPSLATLESQYLEAAASGPGAIENPYSRGLRSLGVTEDMITALREKRRSVGRIPHVAEASGVVTALHFRRGALVAQGASVLQWAALDPAWVILGVPESMAPAATPGTAVSFTTPAHPDRIFRGRVSLVYPDLEAATRSLRARVVAPNQDGALKINMSVAAVLHAAATEPIVHVPRSAVIRGQRADRVIVALGGGRFAPRSVEIGLESGQQTAILRGLKPGELVVTTGVFLIDSEANLEAGLARLGGDLDPESEAQGHAEPDGARP